ncbi:replication factor C subunit 1-like [Copidosoma floridanum]|uniref:replication factor C subunit 1-like n=1 Tax=Copidosoma floridanum TaxID=29053 RepID=UPI0006C9CDEE|nr:replication factor C subunit 1-like [Copidosoma floridanum]XP_014218027.1 replication factor C subunit 1-like [Copidosoma floridanum]
MSKDIRSYFLGGASKKPKSDDKKHKATVITSDEEDEPSTKRNKKAKEKVDLKKASKSHEKAKTKKRTIISSDEEEKESEAKRLKNKKAKVAAEKSNQVKLLREVDVRDVFQKKPISRVNAPKIKKNSGKPNMNFDDDDNFDETLNQLDFSKIENEYLSAMSSDKPPFFEDESKERDMKAVESNDSKKDTDKVKKHGSEKDKKHDSVKKKKDQPHPKLEINRESKPQKADTPKEKKKDVVDFNEIIEEKIDKKKQHAALYQNYLNRGGARNPGSKEVPEGADNCFANQTFLITGVLDSLEREEVEGLIKKYGGKVIQSVSKKLNYMIVGDQPGPSKMSKGQSLGIKMISEDDFLNLLRTSPGKVSDTTDDSRKRKSEDSIDAGKIKPDKRSKHQSPEQNASRSLKQVEINKKDKTPPNDKIFGKKSPVKKEEKKTESKQKSTPPKANAMSNGTASYSNASNKLDDGLDHITALSEKYRPKEMKQIIGQGGDKSNAKKLHYWLKNWHNNHGKNAPAKPKFNQRDDTGMIFKAVLLSGPPGIGKTTTAYVVCADLGFEVIEFNASDTRSKKLLQEEISGILKNKTVKSCLNATEAKSTPPKHVLLMDEVDGMAGNEDRGGMKELISLIKSSDIPVICICNDRQSQKIKSLVNYTFDLRFQKPRLEQIRAAMMSICFKEGIKVSPDEITRIIQSTNQDIRQVINHVAVLSAKSQSGVPENKSIEKYKNLRLGPWDVIRKVFSAEEHKHMSIHDKSDLFFHDYSIAPLFVEENYLIVNPNGPKNLIYDKLAKCSESLAIGDVVDKTIRNGQNWSLLPVQACFSSVMPGSVMSGFIGGQINFPSWLGKNSRTNKCDRLLQDITVHARIITGASKEAVNLDYLKMLAHSIIRPLAVEGSEGVEKSVEIMNKYHLSRDDLDSLLELTKWPHTRDLMQAVDTKTKAAFTRAYNKSASYNSAGTMKKKSAKGDANDDLLGEEDEELASDDEEEDKIENDKLIKAKTSKAAAKNNNASAESTSKGRGKKPASKTTKKKK